MHLTGVRLGNIPPFTKRIELEFNKRVNVFIGPNGAGKSTVLRELYEHSRLRNLDPEKIEINTSDDWPRGDASGQSTRRRLNLPEVPFISVPATRVNLPPEPLDWRKQRAIGNEEFGDELMEAWIAGEPRVFDGAWVELAVEVFNVDRDEQYGKALMLGYECTKAICSELVQDYAPHPFVERRGWEDDFETIVHPGMGIGTIDDSLLMAPAEPLYAGQLSSGTQGTYLWVLHVSLKIAYHYGFRPDWQNQPAILLIDEIENHLHPTWQRRVIPALLKHFPGLQIFATTHSPFVVAGLKAGQVHVLKRDENGVVTATTEPRDVIGWTADEILRGMMGVDEPTDQLTVDRAKRLRELRDKDSLNEAEGKELNQLRRQVNEDLLNRVSPLEAQRERYADLIENFVRSRQADLTQDGE